MKKIITSIVALLLAAPSFAQMNSGGFSISESTLYYGVRIGMNLSTVTGDNTDDLKMKAGLTLGGVLGLRVSDSAPVFLESGLYYTQYGANGDGKEELDVNYLELPVLIKYGFEATDEINVLPYLGPTFGFGVSAKRKYEELGEVESVKGFSDNDLNRFNVGIKIGCGVEWSKLYAELGYHIGISNLADSDSDTMHHGNIFINVGVNF